MVYLKHQERPSQPGELVEIFTSTDTNAVATFQYPTIVSYDEGLNFGQNPFGDQGTLNKHKFEYTFSGVSTMDWSYYTLAVYEHNWGLTEVRKSEF